MTADQTRGEFEEIPFGTGRFKDFVGVDANPIEYDAQFVDQCDVDVPLGVLDDFGGLGHFDAGGTMGAGLHNEVIRFRDGIRAFFIRP